jgi:EthD domain
MIHQFIFAAPKPGLTAIEFQDYWTKVHAVKFASKIPQVKQYLIDTRIPFSGDVGSPHLPHQGIAEIWLENETDQLASLATPEFLDGARADEPNWAAFWLTFVLDTTAYELLPAPLPSVQEPPGVKLTLLRKRRPGLGLQEYRDRSLESYAAAVATLPGLRRHLQAHTRDGAYVFGEAQFDSVDQLWFDDSRDLAAALASDSFHRRVAPQQAELSDPRYVFSLTATEHWITGPDAVFGP